MENNRHNRREIIKKCAFAGFGLSSGCLCITCNKSRTSSKGKIIDTDNYEMVAYCALRCNECDAYKATQNNDAALRSQVAKRWKMKEEEISCDGCKSDNALFNCDAKKCAVERKKITCAHCQDFTDCKKEIWSKWPQLRTKAEELRKTLLSNDKI